MILAKPDFILDACSVISGIKGEIPGIGSEIFQKIAEEIEQHRIFVPGDVIEEVDHCDHQDEAAVWIRDKTKPQFQPDDAELEQAEHRVAEYKMQYPNLNTRSDADYSVLAFAWMFRATVITEERPRLQSLTRLPAVCNEMNISWVSTHMFCQNKGWLS